MSMSVASHYLRILNARGLLDANRVGGHVYYTLKADASVPHSAVLLQMLKQSLRSRRDGVEEVFAALTAVTHPRRIAVLRALRDGPLNLGGIRSRSRMSKRAALRHLDKLKRRGFVGREAGLYCCTMPLTRFGQALLGLVLREA